MRLGGKEVEKVNNEKKKRDENEKTSSNSVFSRGGKKGITNRENNIGKDGG